MHSFLQNSSTEFYTSLLNGCRNDVRSIISVHRSTVKYKLRLSLSLLAQDQSVDALNCYNQQITWNWSKKTTETPLGYEDGMSSTGMLQSLLFH